MRPNTGSILSSALEPRPRGKFRAADKAALEAVLEEEAIRIPRRDPLGPDRTPFVAVEKEVFDLPEEVVQELRTAVSFRYQVWSLDREGKGSLYGEYRVPPKSFFGIPHGKFPTEHESFVCDLESQRLAQAAGRDALREGATLVKVTTYRRKESASRFREGQVETSLFAVMKNVEDEFVPGEPLDKSVELDAKRES